MKIIQAFYAGITAKYPNQALSSIAPADWKTPG
jgi:hypothetical protein